MVDTTSAAGILTAFANLAEASNAAVEPSQLNLAASSAALTTNNTGKAPAEITTTTALD